MKRFFLSLVSSILFATGALAAPTWMVFNVSVAPSDAQKVIEAADALMSSAVGQEFPGRMLLQQSIANGPDPTTHSFAVLYHSAAEAADYTARLQDSPAWPEFLTAMSELTEPVSEIRLVSAKSWGSLDDTDTVMLIYALQATNGAGVSGAIDTFMASATGQGFPGQVHLAAVQAGGPIPSTHSVVTAFASVAEMEEWQDGLAGNTDYQAMLDEIQKHAEFRGASMSQTVKAWGAATTAEVATN